MERDREVTEKLEADEELRLIPGREKLNRMC